MRVFKTKVKKVEGARVSEAAVMLIKEYVDKGLFPVYLLLNERGFDNIVDEVGFSKNSEKGFMTPIGMVGVSRSEGLEDGELMLVYYAKIEAK